LVLFVTTNLLKDTFFSTRTHVVQKMQPRPWWAPLYGLTRTKLWFETLFGSLRDVSDKCYIFLAFASPDGFVKNATGLLPGLLLQEHGLMAALQEVLRMACGFTVE